MSEQVEITAAYIKHWGGFYPGDASAAERFEQLMTELEGTGPALARIAQSLRSDAEFERWREDQ